MSLFIKRIFTYLIFAFCIIFSAESSEASSTRHNILLLNSYHKGFKWTDDITASVQNFYSDLNNFNLIIEYMDTKRFQDSTYFNSLAKLYAIKYKNISCDGIICSDNNALDFIIKYGSRIWNTPQIVFCGVNNSWDYKDIDTTRFNGVDEKIDIRSTINIALKLQPNINEFIVIGDKTKSFPIFYDQFLKEIEKLNSKVSHRLFIVDDIKKLKKVLDNVNPSNKAIYLLSLYINRDGTPTEMAKEAYNAFSEYDIPIYSNWDFLLPNLIVGGKIIKGSDQGIMAAKLMKQKIDSASILLPFVTPCKQEWIFDQKLLNKFNIKNYQLPEGSQIFNKDLSIYFKYKKEVSLAVGLIILLIIIILILISNTIQRRKAELNLLNSENRLELALEGANQGLWDVNISNDSFFINNQFAQLLGYKNNKEFDFTPQNWEKLFYSNDEEHIKEAFYLHNLGKVDSINCEVRLLKKNNHYEWFVVHGKITENHNGKPVRITGSIMNINNQKDFENELLKAKNKAEESDRLKSSFLANMSHEIRTPMNAIMGFADLVTSNSINKQERSKYLGMIKKSGESLLNIINDIIDISKIESEQLVILPEKFELNKFCNNLHNISESLITNSEKNIRLLFNQIAKDNLYILSDPHRLEQILLNLITNSIKFTSHGTIEFGYSIINKNTIEFYVKDTGIGINEEHKKIIFERFRQGDESTVKKFGGTGLGLAICNSLVKMLGGNIEVQSQIDKGATFLFTIKTEISYSEDMTILNTSEDNI